MARRDSKLTSFEEYDLTKLQRLEQVKSEAAKSLEDVLRKESARARNRFVEKVKDVSEGELAGGTYIVFSSQLLQIDEELRQQYREFAVKARRDSAVKTAKEYTSVCLHDLVCCGVNMSKINPDRHLTDDQKHELFVRYVGCLKHTGEMYTSLFDDVPAHIELSNYLYLPQEDSKMDVVKHSIKTLRKKGYVESRCADTLVDLLYPPRVVRRAEEPRAATVKPAVKIDEAPAVDTSAVADYIVNSFSLSTEIAQSHSSKQTLDSVKYLHDVLCRIIGEEYAAKIVRTNPGLLDYSNGRLTKYINTLEDVLKRAAKSEDERLMLCDATLQSFASLDSLIAMKRSLCCGDYAAVVPEPEKSAFDVDDYKRRLIERSGLDVEIVEAMTTGKTIFFIGEKYMPQENFRKNTSRKIAPQKMDIFSYTFDELVRRGVIYRKAKGNPVFRFNPDINEITDVYLREYMRLILHGEKIVRQEGHLTFNDELVRELYGNGSAPKKPL